jgi:FHA domain
LTRPEPDRHRASPAELKERISAERAGSPFLLYRDAVDHQRILQLAATTAPVTIGRAAGSAIRLDWDGLVSRMHAELDRVGDSWVLVDDGLSSNGSFVNEERVASRRRLKDGDRIRVGSSLIDFFMPGSSRAAATRVSEVGPGWGPLADSQRRVLVALCRPYKDGGTRASPATNQQIAEELVLSVPAVKKHLRALAARLDIADLPQNSKRLRLVELAFERGLVSEHEL